MSESQPIDFGSFVFHVPSEKFVYLLKGTWQLGSPITAKALRLLLLVVGIRGGAPAPPARAAGPAAQPRRTAAGDGRPPAR
jgi:hypothetical protein